MTTAQSKATEEDRCGSLQARAILALARTMLDCVVRCQEAVLQDDSETLTVIRHVLKQVREASSEINEIVGSTAELEDTLNALVAFVVQTHEQPLTERSLSAHFEPVIATAVASANGCEQGSKETIANWFFVLSQELNAVHPQAAQMLRLRLLGLDSRQIADRLQLPPRLVRYLFHEVYSGRVLGEVGSGAVA